MVTTPIQLLRKNINVKKDVVFLQRLFVCLTSGFLLAADLKWQIIVFSKCWREQEAFPVELRRKEKQGRYLLNVIKLSI
ncbi:TPA: hypothetical protein ACGO48_002136, partial [Streptococcus suis]